MVLETFTGTDGTALETHDANWHLVIGSGGDGLLLTNALITQDPTGGDWMYSWYGTGGNPGNDQYAELTVVISERGWIGPCVRVGDTSSGNGYHLNIQDTEIYFGMFVGSSYSSFGSDTSGVAIGDKWKMEAIGSAIKVYRNSGGGYALILSQTDSTFASGHLGLAGYPGKDGQRDNFDGAAAGSAGQPTMSRFGMCPHIAKTMFGRDGVQVM